VLGCGISVVIEADFQRASVPEIGWSLHDRRRFRSKRPKGAHWFVRKR